MRMLFLRCSKRVRTVGRSLRGASLGGSRVDMLWALGVGLNVKMWYLCNTSAVPVKSWCHYSLRRPHRTSVGGLVKSTQQSGQKYQACGSERVCGPLYCGIAPGPIHVHHHRSAIFAIWAYHSQYVSCLFSVLSQVVCICGTYVFMMPTYVPPTDRAVV